MTAQRHEVLIVNGIERSMAYCPPIPRNHDLIIDINDVEMNEEQIKEFGLNERISCTDCWRDYVGTWEIKDNEFHLKDIEGKYKLLSKEKILADWFTGVIRIPKGEMLRYIHMGFASVYESEIHIQIEKGIVIKSKEIDNKNKEIYEEELVLDNMPGDENNFDHDIVKDKSCTKEEDCRVTNIFDHKKYDLSGYFREYSDKYEYVLIYKYEQYMDENCLVHSIPIGEVDIQLLEITDYSKDILISSIEFSKENFEIRDALEWADKYEVVIPKRENELYVIHKANKIIEGFKFKGTPIVHYEKGNKKVICDGDYVEITEQFLQAGRIKINTNECKTIKFNITEDNQYILKDDENISYGKKIIYNDKEIDYIPVINIEYPDDLVISNGNIMVFDTEGYIGPYCNGIGFYEGEYEGGEYGLPISFPLDNETPIYIDVDFMPNGGKLCVISFNYIIDKESLMGR